METISSHRLAIEKLQALHKQQVPLVLVKGPKGVGKAYHSRKVLQSFSQARVFHFTPNEGVYKLEQIKEIQELSASTDLCDAHRYFILDDFIDISPVVLNALLKTLEEPQASTSFILIVHDGFPLLPTVSSRAREILFGILNKEELRAIVSQEYTCSGEQLELALELAYGQLNWARHFISDAFLQRRHIYEQLLEVLTASDLFGAIIELEKSEKDRLLLFDEWKRIVQLHWREYFIKQGTWWEYLSFITLCDRVKESMFRGESLNSAFYLLYKQMGWLAE